MMTTDPHRLSVVIRDRKKLIQQLAVLLIRSKKDNAGDIFKINRLYKHHNKLLAEMETYFNKLVQENIDMNEVKRREFIRAQALEIDRLRIEINQWGGHDETR